MKKTAIILAALLSSALFAENLGTTSQSVQVTRSEPVYKTISNQRPVKECWEESSESTGQSGGNDIIGGIVGGAIGGALGNQVGQGSGKTAATIGGAIVGSMIGQGASRGGSNAPQTVQKCKTRYETTNEQVLSGYNNYATFQGRQIMKYSDSPLQYITVYTSVSY
jgi:uncharacterized protein YcfJ